VAPEALVEHTASPICGTHEQHRPAGTVGAKERRLHHSILSINAAISMHTRSALPINGCPAHMPSMGIHPEPDPHMPKS